MWHYGLQCPLKCMHYPTNAKKVTVPVILLCSRIAVVMAATAVTTSNFEFFRKLIDDPRKFMGDESVSALNHYAQMLKNIAFLIFDTDCKSGQSDPQILRFLMKGLSYAKVLFDAKSSDGQSVQFVMSDAEFEALRNCIATFEGNLRVPIDMQAGDVALACNELACNKYPLHYRSSCPEFPYNACNNTKSKSDHTTCPKKHRSEYQRDRDSDTSDCDSNDYSCFDHQFDRNTNIRTEVDPRYKISQNFAMDLRRRIQACKLYLNYLPKGNEHRDQYLGTLHAWHSSLIARGIYDVAIDPKDPKTYSYPANYCPLSKRLIGFVKHDKTTCEDCMAHKSNQNWICRKICTRDECINDHHEYSYCPYRALCRMCHSTGHSLSRCPNPEKFSGASARMLREKYHAMAFVEEQYPMSRYVVHSDKRQQSRNTQTKSTHQQSKLLDAKYAHLRHRQKKCAHPQPETKEEQIVKCARLEKLQKI